MATPAEEAQRALEIAQRQRALERAQNVQGMLGQPQVDPFQQQNELLGVDTSPIPHNLQRREYVRPSKYNIWGDVDAQINAQIEQTNKKIDLLEAGINTAAELPAGVRAGLSLTSDLTLKVAYLQSQGYEVRRTPEGDIQFLDAQSNRWAPIDSVQPTLGDLADLAGMPLPTLFAIG